MVQKAIVKKILDNTQAQIEVTRQSACGENCASCKGCPKPTQFVSAIAKNPLGAKLGDVVTVEGQTQKIFKMAFVVYLIPLILFFVFYFIAQSLMISESIAIFSAILGFVLGICGGIWYNKYVKEKAQVVFTIIDIENN